MTLRILQAVTSVRVGDGASVRSVDLPLARERHTRWPFMPGSALKGALRARAYQLDLDAAKVVEAFGAEPPRPDDEESSLCRGKVTFSAATLLALPVRSVDHTFALVTCPTALARLGRSMHAELSLPSPSIDQASVASDRVVRSAAKLGDDVLGLVELEDLDLVAVRSSAVQAWIDALEPLLAQQAPLDRLVVVHDDVFGFACDAWTEHRTRNAIGPDGTVSEGLLFTVESMPPETLWWVLTDGEAPPPILPADGELFTLGGHQSVGMGRVAWFGGGA